MEIYEVVFTIIGGLILVFILVNLVILRWIFRINEILYELKMIRKEQMEVSNMQVDAMQKGFSNRAQWSDASFGEIKKIQEIMLSMSSHSPIDQSVKDATVEGTIAEY